MAHHKIRPAKLDRMASALRLEEDWRGLTGGEKSYHRARDFRNHVCQVMNRRAFVGSGERAPGDPTGFMTHMICGLLRMMVVVSKAPRGGLASVLAIHPTRMADLLDRGNWPEQLHDTSLRESVRNAALWIMIGRDWRKAEAAFRVPAGGEWLARELFPQIETDAAQLDHFWKVRYADDIAEYFFPFPRSPLQPYFDLNRRDWNAPFDRQEVGMIVRWTRRQMKATKWPGLISFFMPNFETARQLFDKIIILPHVAAAARDKKELAVQVHYPLLKRPEIEDGDEILRVLKPEFEMAAKQFARFRANCRPQSERPSGTGVVFEPSLKAKPVDPAIRGTLAFMYSTYVKKDDDGDRRYQHVYLLRPFSDEDPAEASLRTTPFAFEYTRAERRRFIKAACVRYPDMFGSAVSAIDADSRYLLSN